MPTIRDVAREAGVGVGTVSRVLSGHPRVAPATRTRVEAAVRRLGYRPSSAARALARGQSHTLEVVVPLITRHGYVELLRGIEDGLAETDYALVIRTIERPAARERAFADLGHTSRADGVIFVSLAPPDDVIDRLRQARVPMVLVDREHPAVPGVAVDHAAAAAMATRHLIELGHRRIALVDHPAGGLTPGAPDDRGRGFQEALAGAGLAARPEYLLATELSPEGGMAALETLLALPEPPTATLVGSDTQAVGVLEGARRRGHRVPRDLAVVGYGDIEMSHHIGLTTVRVPVRELGRQGVAALLTEIAQPTSPPARTWLQAELIVRRTTAAPGAGGEGGWLTVP
jgi:DNA-binding LacI/PurR family transcriptional regulator